MQIEDRLKPEGSAASVQGTLSVTVEAEAVEACGDNPAATLGVAGACTLPEGDVGATAWPPAAIK